MIVYGSGNSDGNRHTHANLPDHPGRRRRRHLPPGRHVKLKAQPMSNLYLSMLDRLGVDGRDRLGDSTGRVEGIGIISVNFSGAAHSSSRANLSEACRSGRSRADG